MSEWNVSSWFNLQKAIKTTTPENVDRWTKEMAESVLQEIMKTNELIEETSKTLHALQQSITDLTGKRNFILSLGTNNSLDAAMKETAAQNGVVYRNPEEIQRILDDNGFRVHGIDYGKGTTFGGDTGGEW